MFIKPMHRPTVSDFCHSLTGISQRQVDQGLRLADALEKHLNWLQSIAPTDRITILTHGDWDLGTMLPMDLKNIGYGRAPDQIYQRYVNIKDLFQKITKIKGAGLMKMLHHLKLEPDGRHHSGIDDCHNIARMFIKLVHKGLDKKMFIHNMKYIKDYKYWDNLPDPLIDQVLYPDLPVDHKSDQSDIDSI
jgi:ERI1 exoribonuclease 3